MEGTAGAVVLRIRADAPPRGSTKRRPPECRNHSVRTIECRLRTVTNIAKRHEYDTRLGVIPVRRLIHGGSVSSRRAAKLVQAQERQRQAVGGLG